MQSQLRSTPLGLRLLPTVGGAALAVGLLVSVAWSGEPEPRSDRREVEELVATLHRTGDEQGFRKALRDLDRDAVEPLLEAFLTGDPAVPGMRTGHDPLLIDALRRLGEEEARAAVKRLGPESEPEPARVLYLLGEFGDRGLDELVAIALDGEGRTVNRRELQRALRIAVTRTVQRRPETLRRVGELLKGLDASHAALVLGGIADTGTAQAVDLLGRLATREGELGGVALERLSDAGRAGRAPFPHEVSADLERLLFTNDLGRLASALRALGTLEDPSSLEQVIGHLDHPERRVREAAAAAAPLIAAVTLPLDRARWEAWHERELDWWEVDYPELRDALWGGTAANTLRALAEVVLHPLFRHEIALDLAPLVAHEDPGVRRMVASALGQLGSAAPVEDLLGQLPGATEEEAAQIEAALRGILRRPKPSDPPHWASLWTTSVQGRDAR